MASWLAALAESDANVLTSLKPAHPDSAAISKAAKTHGTASRKPAFMYRASFGWKASIILNPAVGRAECVVFGVQARRNAAKWCDRAGRSSAFRRKVRPRSGMRAP